MMMKLSFYEKRHVDVTTEKFKCIAIHSNFNARIQDDKGLKSEQQESFDKGRL